MRHNFGVFTSCEAAIYNVSLQNSVGNRQHLWDAEVCWGDDNRAGDKSVGKCSVALLCLWITRSKYIYLQTILILFWVRSEWRNISVEQTTHVLSRSAQIEKKAWKFPSWHHTFFIARPLDKWTIFFFLCSGSCCGRPVFRRFGVNSAYRIEYKLM